MTTYVKNDTGMLYREIDSVGAELTVTRENKKYFEQGMVFLRGYGDKHLTLVTRRELRNHFTLLTEGEDD